MSSISFKNLFNIFIHYMIRCAIKQLFSRRILNLKKKVIHRRDIGLIRNRKFILSNQNVMNIKSQRELFIISIETKVFEHYFFFKDENTSSLISREQLVY